MLYKAISIDFDYVCDIFHGEKTEEYRNWPTKHRGDLIICSTADKFTKTQGAAWCIAELYDCVKRDEVYAFLLRNIRPIKPFAVKGQQRIYNLDCEPVFMPQGYEADIKHLIKAGIVDEKRYEEIDEQIKKTA